MQRTLAGLEQIRQTPSYAMAADEHKGLGHRAPGLNSIECSMSSKKNFQKPGRRATPSSKPDGHAQKRFPNGISATILAIQKHWHGISNGFYTNFSLQDFFEKTNFKEAYKLIISKYPGRSKIADADVSIKKLINNITAGRNDFEFYKLRSFSEYIGVPSSILLLYTQFVSREIKAIREEQDPKETALVHIRRIRNIVDAAESEILASKAEDRIFTRKSNNAPGYDVNIKILKRWKDAYDYYEK